MTNTMAHTYHTHPVYYVFIVGTAFLCALLGWDLWQDRSMGALLFVIILVGVLLWLLSMLGIEIQFSTDALQIKRKFPLSSAGKWRGKAQCQTIAYRQLLSVEAGGRVLSTLTLLYYPVEPDGLLDLTTVESVTLPLVTNQQNLLERLEKVIPQ